MTDFLLELRSEEIPARMQLKAKEDLAGLFTDVLAKAGLAATSIETFATPRRLALIAHGLPLSTQAVSEETKGPKVGAPPQALEGFLRKTGQTQDQLIERDGIWFAVIDKPGRATADVLAEAIPAIIRAFPWPKSQRWSAASISTESLRWVRPLQGIIALLGDDVVLCEIEGITSGRDTTGHRFHSSGAISIANAGSYVETLRAAHVIVHYSERCRLIRDGAAAAACAAGLVLVEDEGLVSENAGLTEWPVPMLGRFDPAYLTVPEEVIQLTARVNQKYFVCHDSAGKLANAFVCTANIDANDGGAAIVAGNEKVLAARLSDAKHFWLDDQFNRASNGEIDFTSRKLLETHAAKLSQITFHEKLGTVADKVERVAKLARWLVTERIVTPPLPVTPAKAGVHHAPRNKPKVEMGSSLRWSDEEVEALANLAERAARLCKADLVTGSVGEFPELQGIMGGHLARAQDEPDAIADAIRDHYKPVGQGDDVPTAPVTVAVSLADKLDDLVTYFCAGEMPTGSRDPYALRRAALGAIRIIVANNLRLSMTSAIQLLQRELPKTFLNGISTMFEVDPKEYSIEHDPSRPLEIWGTHFSEAMGIIRVTDAHVIVGGWKTPAEHKVLYELPSPYWQRLKLLDFFADRLKVQQREAGVRHDLIDAVFALGGEDDLVRLLARVHALQAFIGTEDGANLLAGYKRAANLLKSSPGRGGGSAADGGGSPPQAMLDAESPLRPLRGHLPVNGEDLTLLAALDAAEPTARAAIAAEDFTAAMAALASLRAPIDAFFDGVMVNHSDEQIRDFRLSLLARFRDAVHEVADFSKIEG